MWTLTFKDLNGSTILVEVQGGDGVLTGAAEPLVTREQQSDDPFYPVCYQTGYLNIIDQNADGIRPENTFDRPVKVTKDGAVVFLGFLAVEEYTNNFNERPATLSLPLISGVGVLKNVKYIPEVLNMSIWEILRKCLEKSFNGISGFNWAYMYWNFYTGEILKKEICDLAFDTSETFDGKFYDGFNPNLPEESEGYTVLDVLSEICKLFGMTLREDGDSIYLLTSSTPTTTYHRLRMNEDEIERFDTISVPSLTALPASTSMNISRLSSKKQVRITAKTHQLSEDVLSLKNIFNRLAYSNGDSIHNELSALYYYDMYTLDPDVVTVTPSSGSIVSNLVGEQLNVRKFEDLTKRGAVICKDFYFSPPALTDTSVKPTLTISVDSDFTEPVQLLSEKRYFFWDNIICFLDLKIEFDTINWWQEIMGNWNIKDDEQKKTNTEKLILKLNFGPLWYNGNSWQSKECAFTYHYLSPQPLIYTALRNPEGLIIPAPQGHIGRFKLKIISPLNTSDANLKYIRISKINLKLKSKYVNKHVTDSSERRYNAECDSNASESYSSSQNLFFISSFDINHIASYNSILDTLPNITEDVDSGVLTRMQSWYNKSHNKVQFEAIGTNFSPIDNLQFLTYSGIITSRQFHWRDNKTRITLLTR